MIKLSNLIVEQILIEEFYSCYNNGILNESKIFDLIKKHLKKGVAVATLISALTAFNYSEAQAQDMIDSAKVEMSMEKEVNTPREVSDYMQENLEELVNLMISDKPFFEKIIDLYAKDSSNIIPYQIIELRLQDGGNYSATVYNSSDRNYVKFNKDSPDIESFNITGETTVEVSSLDQVKKLKQLYPSSKGYQLMMVYQGSNTAQSQLLKKFSNMVNSSRPWEFFNQKYSDPKEKNLGDRLNSFSDIKSTLDENPVEFVNFIFLDENSDILKKFMEFYSKNELKMNDYLETKIIETGMVMALITPKSGERPFPMSVTTKSQMDDLKRDYPESTHTIEFPPSRRRGSPENMAYQKLYNEYLKYKNE